MEKSAAAAGVGKEEKRIRRAEALRREERKH
jgi:hypothetical protein